MVRMTASSSVVSAIWPRPLQASDIRRFLCRPHEIHHSESVLANTRRRPPLRCNTTYWRSRDPGNRTARRLSLCATAPRADIFLLSTSSNTCPPTYRIRALGFLSFVPNMYLRADRAIHGLRFRPLHMRRLGRANRHFQRPSQARGNIIHERRQAALTGVIQSERSDLGTEASRKTKPSNLRSLRRRNSERSQVAPLRWSPQQ